MSAQLQSLTARLQALSESLKATLHLVDRLAKLNFQPGSQPLDDNGDANGDLRSELSSEIHDSLKQQEEQLELLRQEADDFIGFESPPHRRRESERDREKSRLSIQVARLGEDVRHARAQFRKAQLQAKRNAEAARQKERQLLFSSLQQSQQNNSPGNGSTPPPSSAPTNRRRGHGPDKPSDDDIVTDASRDVTSALRRTQHLLTAELSRSRFASDTLARSNAAVSQLSETYTGLDDLLVRSKGLLATLVTSTKSDTWYLETAFYLLAATICWLVFRRLLYGPVWWLVYFPVRTAVRVLTALLGASAGALGGRKAANSSVALVSRPGSISASMSSAANVASSSMAGESTETQDPSADGSASQRVGQMAEQSRQAEKEPVRRGDGTVLPDRRPDQPPNPKKRAFDVGAEGPKEGAAGGVQQRDEL